MVIKRKNNMLLSLMNNGNQFLPARWYAVKDDMRKAENWELAAEEAILTGEK